jgi:sec-independent protein translocase protein TatC
MIEPESPSKEELDEALQSSPLLSHLIELRQRILKALLAMCLIFLGLFYFANDIYQFLALPLQAQLPEGSTMIATGIVSPFLAPFKLTLVVSLFLAMPVVLHQMWSFVAPGLYSHEKRFALPLLFLSVVLFYSGIAFAYFVVFPLVMGFLMNVGPGGVQVMPDINEYLSIALKLFFAFGMAFEIPVATILLAWSGAVSLESIKEKRAYVLVGCFVFGMLLTPPDVISQIMLAVPMYLLFEVGILFSHLKPEGPSSEEESK